MKLITVHEAICFKFSSVHFLEFHSRPWKHRCALFGPVDTMSLNPSLDRIETCLLNLALLGDVVNWEHVRNKIKNILWKKWIVLVIKLTSSYRIEFIFRAIIYVKLFCCTIIIKEKFQRIYDAIFSIKSFSYIREININGLYINSLILFNYKIKI